MKLQDVLNLEVQPHSLPIIKEYLNQSLSHLDYQAAYNHYFDIQIQLSLFDAVYNEGKVVLNELKTQQETMYQEKILKHIIDAAINLNHLEEAKKWIEMRKALLPMIKQYLGILDDISLKKVLNEPYLDDLLKVLSDMIPTETKIYCLEEVFECYISKNDYEHALETIIKLYEFDLFSTYFVHELSCLIALDKLEIAKTKAFDYHRNHKSDMQVVLKLLEIYIKLKDFHKASILEADYEDQIDQQNDDYRISAYTLIVDLYQELGNKLSLDLYLSKLKKLSKSLDRKIKKEEKEKEKIEPDTNVSVDPEVTQKTTSSDVLRYLEISYELMTYASMIDDKLPLRDFFRHFFMHLDHIIKPHSYAIYIENQTPDFFSYRKERLYDKSIDPAIIKDSLIEHVMYTSDDLYEHTKTIKWDKNVITNETYTDDIAFIYAFPLLDLGVFVVHLEEQLDDPAKYYDLFKMISGILHQRISKDKSIAFLKDEHRFYEQIMDTPIINYRMLKDQRSTYNTSAMKLFNIEKHFHLELFLRDMSYEFVHMYKDIVTYLNVHPNEEKHITYTYQNKNILEKLYSLKVKDDVVIISLFYDQTAEVQQAKVLVEQAVMDKETHLENLYALNQKLDEILEQKVSLLLIELDQSVKHIYGNDEMTHFFKEFAQVTKKFFQDGDTYRFDFNRLFVVLPFNDIRAITKSVKDYYKYLDHYTSKVLNYEKFKVYTGIIRYPVVTVEKSKDKLYKFLDISIEKAKRKSDETYDFFVYKDYENELFEQQVIDHLNAAIETKNIGLIFNQMIDIKKNVVWQYESELVLTNLAIDSKYLIKIAEKRNRLVDIEHFHIEQVCAFLVELEKQTERLIKITIPISKPTFLDAKFNTFLLGTLKAHGIPYEFIRLKFNMDLRASHYSNQIQELIDHGIGLDTTSLDMALNYPFHALHLNYRKESIKWQSYVKQMKQTLDQYQMALVIRDVKTKDQKEVLERLDITYIEGHIYKELPAPILLRKIKESL